MSQINKHIHEAKQGHYLGKYEIVPGIHLKGRKQMINQTCLENPMQSSVSITLPSITLVGDFNWPQNRL